jgi:hypothetical protein
MTKVETRYGITAEELHARIIDSMRFFGEHMSFRIGDILDRHDQHPLEQTINSVMWRIHLDSKKKE